MQTIRPDHPYIGEELREEVYQPDNADWPLYNVTVHKISAEESFYGTPGFSLGLSIKQNMESYWEPVDPWNPLPFEMGPVVIEKIGKIL
jgi:hypothetical protein